MITNLDLVAWARKLHDQGAVYWYGTVAQKCAKDLLQQKAKQYPNHYGPERMARYESDIKNGLVAADCVGLIKSAFWTDCGQHAMKYKSGNMPDTNANGLINLCTLRGSMKDLPELPGLIMWKDGHVGVYAGNGKVIEARGFKYGIPETNVKDRGWLKWGKLPPTIMLYVEAAKQPDMKIPEVPTVRPTIRKGSKGDYVILAQKALLAWKSTCLPRYGADGDFGGETDAAVRAFQKAKGLTVDGIVGKNTWAALLK